ncbi:MAG: alpha/beta hydrolase [Alphaproteobacteria bacterium]|nr:alpha/beta hydrolase [Alphaproteobacteria bacterium]
MRAPQPGPEFQTKTVLAVDGQRLVVFEQGRGEPCFLLHGYPQTHRCWRGVAARLSKTHRVIAPDWFGSGESERSLSSRPSYEREVARIGMVLDALRLDRVNYICHDYGGFLGLGFALAHERRLLRLAVINSRAQGNFAPFSYILFNAFSAIARLPGGEAMLALLPLYTMHRLSLQRYVANGSFSQGDLEEYIGYMRTFAGRQWLGHVYRYFQATRRRALREGLPKLRTPTAVIWGDRDPFSPVKIGMELAALVPDATFHRLAGADHFSPEERADEVSDALLKLLSRPARDDG